jgi:hypothetical protein
MIHLSNRFVMKIMTDKSNELIHLELSAPTYGDRLHWDCRRSRYFLIWFMWWVQMLRKSLLTRGALMGTWGYPSKVRRVATLWVNGSVPGILVPNRPWEKCHGS